MDALDFNVRHAPQDERHAKWLVDLLGEPGFRAATLPIDEPFQHVPRVGELVVLSRSSRVPQFHRGNERRLGVRIDDVDVPRYATVNADVTISELDHRAAADVLRAIAKQYGERLPQARNLSLGREIEKRQKAAQTQLRAFLSYRRDDRDSFHTARAIKQRLGLNRVFWDRESLPPGVEFAAAIESELNSCAVLLALIGPYWAKYTDGTSRLGEENDWIRVEVGLALRRSDVAVIPVLLSGARPPEEVELPPDLASLPGRQTIALSDSSWDEDFARLMTFVEQRLADDPIAMDTT
jgi:TIR domain